MSLKRITIVCDFPGCEKTLETDYYLGCLHEARWAAVDTLSHYEVGPHLCPKHTRQDYTDHLEKEARRTKYEELKKEFNGG